MGASGSAWIKPKKRKGLRSDTITNSPHPRFARTGQRYFPLTSRATNVVTLKVARMAGSHCELTREDDAARIVRVQTERLLAASDDGIGRHYRFVGYAPRAGYRTHAVVIDVSDDWARLVVPEWHPEVPVTVATGSVPGGSRCPGAWLACRADLGADAGARVQPHAFTPAEPQFDPSIYELVTFTAPLGGDTRSVPETGQGCGDVVLFLAQEQIREAMEGSAGLYLTGHPPPVRPGGRAYLHASGEVAAWREVAAVQPLPSGTRIVLRGAWIPASVEAEIQRPASGIARGRHGRQLWAWRSWPRDG